jgi:AcrR family transcriptional regulator
MTKKQTTRGGQRQRLLDVTREDILSAARKVLAKDGPEGLSVVQVASLAGVNRGTAYQHFADRDSLLQATIESVSKGLIEAVWPPSQAARGKPGIPFDDASLEGTALRLAAFTAENTTFSRIWLFELLSSDKPGGDPFSRAWIDVVSAFCKSDDAVPGIDGEIYAIISLIAYLALPVWMHSEHASSSEREAIGARIAREILRLAMYGVMKPDRFPAVATWVAENGRAEDTKNDMQSSRQKKTKK